MKKSFLLLLLGMVVILTSMSKCFSLTWDVVEHSTVSAKVNGELFESAPTYTYESGIILNPYEHPSISLDVQNEFGYFGFDLSRKAYSEAGDTCWINISVYGTAPIELNKKYPIGNLEESQSYASLSLSGNASVFRSTEGYMTFTQLDEENDYNQYSGVFEFVAETSDSDSTLFVTEGTFEKLN